MAPVTARQISTKYRMLRLLRCDAASIVAPTRRAGPTAASRPMHVHRSPSARSRLARCARIFSAFLA